MLKHLYPPPSDALTAPRYEVADNHDPGVYVRKHNKSDPEVSVAVLDRVSWISPLDDWPLELTRY